jgi:hypothetical protein
MATLHRAKSGKHDGDIFVDPGLVDLVLAADDHDGNGNNRYCQIVLQVKACAGDMRAEPKLGAFCYAVTETAAEVERIWWDYHHGTPA